MHRWVLGLTEIFRHAIHRKDGLLFRHIDHLLYRTLHLAPPIQPLSVSTRTTVYPTRTLSPQHNLHSALLFAHLVSAQYTSVQLDRKSVV